MLDKKLELLTIQSDANKEQHHLTKMIRNNNNNIEIVNETCLLSELNEEGKDNATVNWLVEKLEKRLKSGNKFELGQINRILENAIHWCLVNGFVLVPKDRKVTEPIVVSYLPFTLFPSPIQRRHFEQATALQVHVNQLISNVANSSLFMEKAFEDLIKIDDFLLSLWQIYQKSLQMGYNQKISLIIVRTDYMMHNRGDESTTTTTNNTNNTHNDHSLTLKQVETNTIAAGFGYVGTRASQLHREILKWFGPNHQKLANKCPHNEPVVKMGNAIVEAWRLYNSQHAVVLFIVLDYEINIADQRHLEYEVTGQEPDIEVIRCTLRDVCDYAFLSDDKTLFFNDKEVAIVYYRAGYDPSHFKTQNEWNALLKIELSKAVKCPSVGTFLAGMKKIQEFVSHHENLVEICNDNHEMVESLKETFVDIFKLDKREDIEKVYENPESYVLKPQREGGGNNLFDSQIKDFLKLVIANEDNVSNGHVIKNGGLDSELIPNKDLFIVMEKIKPVITDNYIVSPKQQAKLHDSDQKLRKVQITNELGIFGVLVKNGDEIVLNETAGYCLRSKPAAENESGVMCGSGALDSLLIVD